MSTLADNDVLFIILLSAALNTQSLESQMDCDWLSMIFLLFISWKKKNSENDSNDIVPPSSYSCVVDFLTETEELKLYCYGYFPWCKRAFLSLNISTE